VARGKAAPRAPKASRRRLMVVQKECLEDLPYFVNTKPKTASRILDLMSEALRDPFRGLGKPEPLKHLGPDIWSRRVTELDRLVYKVYDDRIDFLQSYCLKVWK
jgi:toxin YoeB